jgi:2-polyprenyl-6-methoxyphenol hydroxylase-like FAD-dependent oxidoreductase
LRINAQDTWRLESLDDAYGEGLYKSVVYVFLTTSVCRKVHFVKCNKLGGGKVILIGDAAHSMSPNIGLGWYVYAA